MKIFFLNRQKLFFVLILSLYFYSCSPTKYLEENDYILTKVKIECDNKKIDTKKILKYNKQKPIRKAFGFFAFHSRVYNIPNPKKDAKRNIKKAKRLKKKNKKIVDNYSKKSEKLLTKKNIAKKELKIAKQKNDSINIEKYQLKFDNLSSEYAERSKNTAITLLGLKKEKVFTWYDWLRDIGEPPPIYDAEQTEKSKEQFKLYLRNKGYYDAEINTTYKPKVKKRKRKQKIKVIYTITTNEPLIINEIEYIIPDTVLKKIILNKENNLIFEENKQFDIEYLQERRKSISDFLKDVGYFYFTKDYIRYQIDTIGRGKNVKLIVNVKQFTDINNNKTNHKRYFINNINIFSDYNPSDALRFPVKYFENLNYFKKESAQDTFNFIYKNEIIIKPKFILNELYISPNSIYNFTNVKNTYAHLSKFQIYKLTNIQFKEIDTANNFLDCNIQLTPTKRHTPSFDIEGTVSSNNFGGQTSFGYTHKNLFHGGEVFDIRVWAALERQNSNSSEKDSLLMDSLNFFNIQEYGVELSITIPRLLSPFKQEKFIKKNNPKTVFSLAFSYQDRPEYNRISSTINLKYFWKNTKNFNHVLTPVRLSLIQVSRMSQEFKEWLDTVYIADSYEDHFIIGSNYGFTFSNQEKNKANYIFLALNTGIAGNFLSFIMAKTNQDTIEGSYVVPFLKTKIAQFAKADIDFRYYHNFNEDKQFASRFFVGIGYPYGNMNLLPFSEKYFSGGANSIRAWQVRSLGPGSYVKPKELSFPNQTADIKLEGNFEYRFNIISIFDGAIFVDVGNIWAINEHDNRENAKFEFDTFYKQIAVGTGFGIRLDINFFIIRFDIGIKLKDPSAPENQRWIPITPILKENYTINFGIGYPF